MEIIVITVYFYPDRPNNTNTDKASGIINSTEGKYNVY